MDMLTNDSRWLARIQRSARIPILLAALAGVLPACASPRIDEAQIVANTVVAQCDRPGIVKVDVVDGTQFNVDLPSFGRVCFLARRHLANPAEQETDLIGFELWRDGALAYSLPMPQGYLWNELCQKILAVAFSHHGDQTDIIVLGSCTTAGRDDLSRPLIFSSQHGGFAVDAGLTMATLGLNTIKQVQRKIRAIRASSKKEQQLESQSSRD
jgi:hypothetical protein